MKFGAVFTACALAFFLIGTRSDAQDACAKFTMQTFSGIVLRGDSVDFGAGPVCRYFQFRANSVPKLDKIGFFVAPVIAPANCPDGTFDGTLCYLRSAPENAFLYKNGFHVKLADSKACPFNMVFDGVNCFWRRAAFGTTAIQKNGNWYTTPAPRCSVVEMDANGRPKPEIVFGAFDGSVCRIAARPENAPEVSIGEYKGALYAVSGLPKTN